MAGRFLFFFFFSVAACCVYIEVRDYFFYGLSEGASVLSRTRTVSERSAELIPFHKKVRVFTRKRRHDVVG